MRSYPRTVFRGKDDSKKVFNESEEIQASSDGYESHWDTDIIEKRDGTDRAILKTDVADIKTDTTTIEKTDTQELTRGQKIALSRKRNKELNVNG
jgi:hypothetical protein